MSTTVPLPPIVVIGSVNADLVVHVAHRPRAGETVLGGDLATIPGGKGANQAVAAARLGARVALIGCVGSDPHGDLLIGSLAEAGVDVTGVRRVPAPTGTALITVTPDGDNAIIVSPGANHRLDPADVDQARDAVAAASVAVLQMELPAPVVHHAALLAASLGTRVVLNLAPPADLPAEVLAACDPLVVNEHEAAALLGLGRPAGADEVGSLLDLGPRSVVLTLGADGAVAAWPGGTRRIPAPVVTPVDTTGAGDALTGALAWRLSEGDALADAASYAVRVGSTAVLRRGAQPSFPGPDQVLAPA